MARPCVREQRRCVGAAFGVAVPGIASSAACGARLAALCADEEMPGPIRARAPSPQVGEAPMKKPPAGGFVQGRAGRSGLLQVLDRLEHFLDMPRDLDAAPFGHEHAAGVDQEGRALDALDLLAVHDLVLDHAEHVAQLLFGVGDQFERQLEALLELVVRRHVVARNAKNDRACLDELGVHVAKLHGLGGTTRRVVLGVEIQHHGAALEGMRRELDTMGGECFKFRERFVQCRRHVGSRSNRRSIWCA